eukprot:jgi/Tetstr1/427187/TSEL_017375.t1
MEAGERPAGTSWSARRRKRRRSARARAAAEAAEGSADAAVDGVPPAVVVDGHRRAAKLLTAVHELRRARQALDTADLGMVSDAAAALHVLEALHPPPAPTNPEYSPPDEPPGLRRAPPSWGGNADDVRRPASRCESLGVGSVLVRLASAHALVHVGADAREVMGPTGFLSRMMLPSELDPFLEAVDAANISAAFSLLEAERNKLAADPSSAPVQGVHRYYPFVVEDRGRLGKSALTVVYIFAAAEDRLTYLRRFKCKKALTGEERVAERLACSRFFDTSAAERSNNGVDGLLNAVDDKRLESASTMRPRRRPPRISRAAPTEEPRRQRR